MIISFIEPHLEVFGGIRRVLELSNRLVDMGERVSIYHPKGTPCEWMTCKAQVKPLHEVLRDKHDVIVFNDPPDYKIARRADARLKVFFVLGLYERTKLERFTLKIFWPKKGRVVSIKRILQLPFLKITSATWMQKYLQERLNVKSELVLGGISRDIFHPVDVERDPETIRVLCSGDPRIYKGTRTIKEALRLVKKKYPNVILDTYYGKGIPQNLMAEKYCSADIFVDAQWDTGCGWNNPVAEAMACKVPVVCTDIGGVQDFAVNEVTALLVPEKEPEAVAMGIIRLIEDKKLGTRLKERAYKHILRFDWDKSARRIQEIFCGYLNY